MKQTLWTPSRDRENVLSWVRGACWDARRTSRDISLMRRFRDMFKGKHRFSKHRAARVLRFKFRQARKTP